ncbi:hypothetical protein [Clostridium sp.]|uniref:hypothetical protein n=1 Tax=Clostridium sp. TaxID=1506 RepID=UPI001A5C8340|nr:hypothetical protein [Clostridium sp.]MBK5237180.1 hypothetical protein [Clostridium sp.]
MKYLWLAVTTDKYEFPIYIEDTAEKLANKLGIHCTTVITSILQNKSGRNSGRKLIKIIIDNEE